MEILCFFIGILYFYSRSNYVLISFVILYFFRPRPVYLLVGASACLYAAFHQWQVCEQGMPQHAIIYDAALLGVITSVPNQTTDKTKFEFDVTQMNGRFVKAHLQLSCYQNCPKMRVGQRWLFMAKLHRVHNFSNPGSFDYKTLMEARHIRWTGTIKKNSMHNKTTYIPFNILKIREALALHLSRIFTDETTLGIVQALTIGVTNHISPESWTLFRNTGTTHLMVISGAHIGLIAGMLFKLILYIWSRSKYLCLYYPAQKIASIFGILAGGSYALIAGCGVPAQRAVIAAIVIFLRYLGRRSFSAWQAWRFALLMVLLLEPHAVLMPGCYLSFMAVGILLTMNRRMIAKNWLKGLGIQLACMMGLLPFTVYWFSYGAVNGLFANLLAIPLVSFIIVPLSLISLGIGSYSSLLITILKSTIAFLLLFLKWINALDMINIKMNYQTVIIPLLWSMAMLTTTLMPLKTLLPATVAMLLIVFCPPHDMIPNNEFQANIMDVGQGLAVIIRTRHHTLIYDTGGQMYHGSDMGQVVIIPYLRLIRLNRIDKIVISHPDLDHRGGLESIESAYPGAELIVDNPQFYHRGTFCHTKSDWTWDGVRFHFFSLATLSGSKNNRSCVLQISNSNGQLLLTGDIEQQAENYLVHHYGKRLHSTLLLVPHHGSKTSSSLRFLRSVHPEAAIVSYGFDNRYHFPHKESMRHYHNEHIGLFSTMDQGMITIRFQKKSFKINAYVD